MDKSNGDLTFNANTNSGGIRPVSIAYVKKNDGSNNFWVVVANQWNNPNIQKEGASIERYPNNDWFDTDLTTVDQSDALRNITLFSFNSATGVLTQKHVLDTWILKF